MRGLIRSFSRRAWLGVAAASLARAKAGAARGQALVPSTDNDVLSRLRPGHPRLILLDSELDRVRVAIRDIPLAKRLFNDLEKEAERLQTTLPVDYKLVGPRLLAQSRRVIDRVGTLSLLFRLTGREPYLHRAVLELKAAANFKDWNPAHFLDTAEMTQAFAIGYDWLYPALSFEDRAWIAGALVNKGLDPALAAYQSKASWTTSRFYWNPVCNSGIALGALAVAEDFAPKSAAILKDATESLQRALPTWNNDGGWPEGLTYWDAATRSASLLFAAYDSALAGDSALIAAAHGFERTGRFRIYTTSPSFRMFNFGDGSEDLTAAPEMQWMARRFSNPAYAWHEQRLIERGGRADFYDLAWFYRDPKPPLSPQWPFDAVFRGVNVATFRSNWEDTNAIFLAVKGGDNKAPHSHYDLGSFVLDAGGVRFALDLPLDDTHPGGPYRIRTEAHNTLLIDGENQDGTAEARIVRQELGADLSWVQIDLSKANGTRTNLWQRRIGMAQRQAVVVEDVVESDRPIDIVWGMLTDADLTVNGQTAMLQKGKWSLAAEIHSPRHAVFDVASVRLQSSGGTYRKLIVRLGEKVTDLRLNVTLTPFRTGTPKPKVSTQIPV